MRLWILAFVGGIVTLQIFSKPPQIIYALLLVCLLLVLWLCCTLPTIKKIMQLLFAASLGFLWILLFTHNQLNHVLLAEIENKKVTVTGIIASIPEPKGSGLRFQFAIKQWHDKEHIWQQPLRVKLSWYQGKNATAIRLPRVGERWQLQVKLKQPHGFHNPGSFNYETSLFAHHIRATGYVVNGIENSFVAAAGYHHPIDQIRQLLNDRLNKALGGYPLAGQIKALTIGMSDAINQAQWQVFKATGTVHLMVIAGLHIGLVSGFIFFIVHFLWRRSTRLSLHIPANQAAACASLIMAWIYSALAGFSIPTERAMIMISVFMGMQLVRRELPAWNAYCLALLVVVLLDPLSTLEAGFWLSFAAVALIIYGISGRLRLGNHWSKLARIQVILGIGLIPLTLLWFQQASLSGIIANAIAIPWVGFIVAPLSLIGAFLTLFAASIGGFVLVAAERAMELFWPVLQWLAQIKFANWQQAIPNTWVMLAALFGVIFLLAPKGVPGRWLGGIGLLPLFFYIPPGPKLGDAWLTLLDVGQGLAVVVQTQHHVLVYDTGPKFSPEFDTGEAVVVPYLRTLGIKHLNTLVISHEDNDHIGGAASLLQVFSADKIFTSVPERLLTNHTQYCLRGLSWQWDGVDFKFLYPPADHMGLDNNSSCVLRISVDKQQILLTGDIEKAAEEYLLHNNLSELAATILVAPHHGSSTSSTIEFVQAVHPRYVLFPVGYLNKYHFPKANVVERYQQIGAKMYDTAQYGAIRFKLDGLGR